MKRSLLEIYALLVCLIAALTISLTSFFLIWNVIKLNAPSFTLSDHHFKCHENNHEYRKCFSCSLDKDEKNYQLPTSESELSVLREKSYETVMKVEHRDARQGLVWNSIVFILSWVCFAIHWRMAQRTRAHL